MKLKVRLDGAEELLKRLSPDALRISLFIALTEAQRVVFDEAKTLADKHTKAGAMKHSIRMLPMKQGDGQSVILAGGPGAPYTIYVHEGFRPFEIRPKTKKVLRWPAATGFAFAKKVNHPGYKGDPFMTRAFEAKRTEIKDIVQELIMEAMR